MLLELGAGDRPYEDGRGWIHNDARSLPDIEIVCDAIDILDHVEPSTVKELMVCHLLEHFPRRDTAAILSMWRIMLKATGKIHIEVPNLFWQCQALVLGTPDPSGRKYSQEELVEFIFGSQDYSGNFHKTGFTVDTLTHNLLVAGFRNVRVTDVGQVLVASAIKGGL